MHAVLINGMYEERTGTPTLDEMQEIVGGYITHALRVPSQDRKGVTIDMYVNDEGLLMRLPIYVYRLTDGAGLAGNAVIVATDRKGETIPALAGECAQIGEYLVSTDVLILPNEIA